MTNASPEPSTPPSPPGSTAPADRIELVDILRALALLGVLLVNLETGFRTTTFEQFVEPQYATAIDTWARQLLWLFMEFKAFALFSFLFGIGMAMQYERFDAGARSPAALLLRRQVVLLGFGVVHLVLIWNGDILTEYALAGLIVVPFLFMRAGAAAVGACLLLLFYLWQPWLLDELGWSWPTEYGAHIAHARAVYGAGSLLETRALNIGELQLLLPLYGYVFARTVGLMLLGVTVWKLGLIRNWRRHAALFRYVAAVCLPSGLLLTVVGRSDAIADELAAIHLAVGYASLLFGYGDSRFVGRLRWIAPLGRMAFTNYLTQSVVLSVIFYGFGFGLLGRVGVGVGLLIGLAIYTSQALLSVWWLKTHKFGPLEWLWRSLTYGRPQAWKA